jgi:hypothetical protein
MQHSGDPQRTPNTPEAARQGLSVERPGGCIQRRDVRGLGVELAASLEGVSVYLDFLVALSALPSLIPAE